MLTLEDCNCPICMCIFIEPVTLPCKHTLCMPCFKHNVEETSLTCPLCRTRIATWSRRATKNKKLVDEKLWNEIQKFFPKKVQDRLDGKEDSDDNEDSSNAVPVSHLHLAAPGEIRKEYEVQLKQLEKQRNEERAKEQEASEALIRRLQEEEEREVQRRQDELNKLQQADEELARELSQVIKEAGVDSPDLLLRESRSRQTRSTCTSVSSTSSVSRPASGTLESLWSKVRPPESADSPITVRETSSIVSKSSCKTRGIGTSELPVLTEFDLPDRLTSSHAKMIDCDLTLSRSNSSGSHLDNLTEYDLARRESSHSSSSTIMYETGTYDDTRGDNPEKCMMGEKPSCSGHQGDVSQSDMDRHSKCTSADSNDSISVELSHFRPIKICPRTPPKRLASGKVIDPPLIRTTPRNLSRAEFSSPVETKLSDIDASSPIMQRQLLSLAEERKHHVELMSKSTATSKSSSIGDKTLCRSSLKKFAFTSEGGKKSEPSATVSSTDCVDLGSLMPATVFKSIGERDKIPNSLSDCSAPKKLIIPLEPKLDEFNISPLSTDLNSPGKLSVQNISRKRIRRGSQHSPSAICSPQRTIHDWVIKTNNSSCGDANPSPDLILDAGRDELDGDIVVTEKGESMNFAKANQQGRSRVRRTKGQTNTIHKFLSKAESKSDESNCVVTKNKQKVCFKQKGERQWTNTELNSSDDESVFSSSSENMDRLSSSEESDFHYERNFKPTRRKRKKVLEESTDNSRQKKQLKTLPATRRKRENMKKGRIKNDYIGTFYSKKTSLNIVSQDQERNSKHVDQEELDRLFAIQLQKQFELESKFNMSAQRFKGGKDEYHLRRKKCR